MALVFLTTVTSFGWLSSLPCSSLGPSKSAFHLYLLFNGGEDFNEFVVLLHYLFNMFRKCIMEGNDQDMLNKRGHKTTNSLKSLPPSKISTNGREIFGLAPAPAPATSSNGFNFHQAVLLMGLIVHNN